MCRWSHCHYCRGILLDGSDTISTNRSHLSDMPLLLASFLLHKAMQRDTPSKNGRLSYLQRAKIQKYLDSRQQGVGRGFMTGLSNGFLVMTLRFLRISLRGAHDLQRRLYGRSWITSFARSIVFAVTKVMCRLQARLMACSRSRGR